MEKTTVSVGTGAASIELTITYRSAAPTAATKGFEADTTGLDLWPASKRLAELCMERFELIRRARCVLELGGGAGLPGLTAATMRKGRAPPVVMTDSEGGALELMRANAELNSLTVGTDVAISTLDWTDPTVPAEWAASEDARSRMWCGLKIILASDVVYSSASVAPLVTTLGRLRAEAAGCEVVLLLANQVIKTVAFNADREPVVDTDDSVLEGFINLAKADGWCCQDFPSDDGDDSRLLALGTNRNLIEEIMFSEEGIGFAPSHMGEVKIAAPLEPAAKKPKLGRE